MLPINVARFGYWIAQNEVFYRKGIFGIFFFGGGNFASSKTEFPVALVWNEQLTQAFRPFLR